MKSSFLSGLILLTVLFVSCSGQKNTVTAIVINPIRPSIVYIATNDGIYKTRDAGETWGPVTEGLGGTRVISLAIHPIFTSTVFAGTMGDSVYRSLDGGQHWGILNAGMKEHVSVVNTLIFDPQNPEIFYAGTTVGVYKSINQGLMWDLLPNKNMDSVYVVPFILDVTNPNILYAGTSGGVYRSRDGGEIWELLSKGMFEEVVETGLALGINSVVQDPQSPKIFYAATTRGGFKSSDGAESWEKIGGGLGERFISVIILMEKNPNILYAGTSKGVLKSTDSGKTWKAINEGLSNLTVRALAAHPKKENVLYAGTHGGIFKTEDAGSSWKKLN